MELTDIPFPPPPELEQLLIETGSAFGEYIKQNVYGGRLRVDAQAGTSEEKTAVLNYLRSIATHKDLTPRVHSWIAKILQDEVL